LPQRFRGLVAARDVAVLGPWLADAQASTLPSFASLANGITADHSAVEAPLTTPWSNGLTEGQVQRIKLIKRQIYGWRSSISSDAACWPRKSRWSWNSIDGVEVRSHRPRENQCFPAIDKGVGLRPCHRRDQGQHPAVMGWWCSPQAPGLAMDWRIGMTPPPASPRWTARATTSSARIVG
jgi:Transposase